uniref:Uncharacterized protein n=1 Tax=Anguilla anguilla TaxID=7936 RepID=A0A0E9UE25_ANGAN
MVHHGAGPGQVVSVLLQHLLSLSGHFLQAMTCDSRPSATFLALSFSSSSSEREKK